MFGACQPQPADGLQNDDSPTQTAEGDPDTAQPGPATITLGDLSTTARDLLATLEWRALNAGSTSDAVFTPTPADADPWWTDPESLDARIRGLFQQLAVETIAAGFEPDAAQLDAAWSALPNLVAASANWDSSPETGTVPDWHVLEWNDVRRFVRQRALYAQWAEQDTLSDDELFDAYLRNTQSASLIVYRVENVPTDDDINRIIAQNAPAIDARYEEVESGYLRPPTAHVRIVRRNVDGDWSEEEDQDARDAMRLLRERAIAEGIASIAVEHSDDSSAARGGDLGWVVRRQLPAAFEVESGEFSEVLEDSRGLYFLMVEDRREATRRPLDDAMRREIAAFLVRSAGPTAEMRRTAGDLVRRVSGTTTPLISGYPSNVSVVPTPPFAANSDGMIPGVGRVPDLVTATFADDDATPGTVVTASVVDDGDLLVAVLVDRQDPTRESFEAQREAFAESHAQIVEGERWQTAVDAIFGENQIAYDVERLSIELQTFAESVQGDTTQTIDAESP